MGKDRRLAPRCLKFIGRLISRRPSQQALTPFKLPVLILSLAITSYAEELPLTAKLCAPGKDLRGTCFYDANGSISYWIVRHWSDGSPDIYGPELTGYPSVLTKQQEYNRWVSDSFHDGYNSSGHGGTGIPGLSLQSFRGDPADLGWADGKDFMFIPTQIPEDGQLNEVSLSIPLYRIGAEILSSKSRLRLGCRQAEPIFEWISERAEHWMGHYFWTSSGENDGRCIFDDRGQTPENVHYLASKDLKELREWREQLKAWAVHLTIAQETSLRYQKLVRSGETAHLTALQSQIEAHVRDASEVENRATEYLRLYYEKWEATKQKELGERMNPLSDD